MFVVNAGAEATDRSFEPTPLSGIGSRVNVRRAPPLRRRGWIGAPARQDPGGSFKWLLQGDCY